MPPSRVCLESLATSERGNRAKRCKKQHKARILMLCWRPRLGGSCPRRELSTCPPEDQTPKSQSLALGVQSGVASASRDRRKKAKTDLDTRGGARLPALRFAPRRPAAFISRLPDWKLATSRPSQACIRFEICLVSKSSYERRELIMGTEPKESQTEALDGDSDKTVKVMSTVTK